MALDCTRLLFSADTGSRRSALLAGRAPHTRVHMSGGPFSSVAVLFYSAQGPGVYQRTALEIREIGKFPNR